MLNKALKRTVHRGPTLNDIIPRLAGVKYLTLTDASSGYHNLKLDEQSSCLSTFSCPFGRYRYILLPFRVVPVGDMFQKIDEISGMPNAFSTADDILIADFDEQGMEHNAMLDKICRICRQPNLKLEKDKCMPRFLKSTSTNRHVTTKN